MYSQQLLEYKDITEQLTDEKLVLNEKIFRLEKELAQWKKSVTTSTVETMIEIKEQVKLSNVICNVDIWRDNGICATMPSAVIPF